MCAASFAIKQDISAPNIHGAIKALVVEDKILDQLILKEMLVSNGYDVCIVSTGKKAVEKFVEYEPDIIFMDLNLPDISGYRVTKKLKSLSEEKYIPIIFVTATCNDESLSKCLESGGDDFIVKPLNEILFKAKIESLLRIKKIHDDLLHDKQMASSYNDEQLKDLHDADKVIYNIHKPRFYDSGNIKWSYVAQNILSGDIICSAVTPSGKHIILVGDNTGHGLPAAIGSIITSETFYSMVSKGFDIQIIIEEINNKLYYLLPSDRFLAACIMEFSDSYNVMKIWTAGIPDVLICNSKGMLKEKILSMSFPLGIRMLTDKEIIPIRIHLEEDDRIYAYTDGLTEVFNESSEMYGENRLLSVIKSTEHLERRVDEIVNDTKIFSNNAAPTDDILLLEISCDKSRIIKKEKSKISSNEIEPMTWQVNFSLETEVLCKTNPVTSIVQTMVDIQGFARHREKIFLILTEMYSNSLEHGILNLDSTIKEETNGFIKYYELRQSRLDKLTQGNIVIDVKHYVEDEKGIISFTIEDDGVGFEYAKVISELAENTMRSGRGIALLYDLCRKCEYSNGGRKLNVEYEWQLESIKKVA